MTQVLDWQRGADSDKVIGCAVQALSAGKLVAFPTETVYGLAASAGIPEAVERLGREKGRPAGKPLALAIRSSTEAMDWVPEMSLLGRRLARRCWPGPVTLVFPANPDSGRAGGLSESVRQRVCPAGTLGLRVPAHEAILRALQQMPAPLVLTSANRSGQPAATRAQEVVEAVGPDLAVIIDDGPSLYGQASTVVQVNGTSWRVLREGAYPEMAIERCAACQILFVCTGNTCRSPLAEGICKKLLADRLQSTVEQLPKRGFVVQSAGLTAVPGAKVTAEALAIAGEFGIDLSAHASRPLTETLVAQADYVLAMTRSHLLFLGARYAGPVIDEGGWGVVSNDPSSARQSPLAAATFQCCPRLLSNQAEDVLDPIGGDLEVYRECARKLFHYVEEFLVELEQQQLLPVHCL
jgi:protein-tyrosine phosphatase